MILIDDLQQGFADAIPVNGLTRNYPNATIMITRATGDVGRFDRLPVRLRVERGGFILLTTLSVKEIDEWFDNRATITTSFVASRAIQSWIVVVGVVEGNLFSTVGDSSIKASELEHWLTTSRLAGCMVTTVSDSSDLEALCSTINATMLNNGEVLKVSSIESLLSTVPHVGAVAHLVTDYTGSVWAALAFLTNRDLFSTLPTSPKARVALGDGTFTREHHKEVRAFFGLESTDLGIGLYIGEE